MMFWYRSHWVFWQAGLMWAGVLLFWGLLIWGAYALMRDANRKSRRAGHDDARGILDRRLASGEIDADEYRRLRDLISAKDTDDRVSSGSESGTP